LEHPSQHTGNVTYLNPDRGRPTARVIRLTAAAIDRRLNPERADPETAEGVITVDEEVLMAAVGRQIRQWRHLRGMSQSDLAEAVRCDRSAVCRWESGQRAPSLAHLVALGRALRCPLATLLDDDA
jgi:ribosome-binding protein aMBF1 (putative translation factor)